MERFNLSQGANGNAPTVRLNNGFDMPVVGIGTYSLRGSTCVRAVKTAIRSGYRMIDTAYMYGNEREVGEAVRQSEIPRSEIFVITKLYPDQYDHAERAIEEALKKLDIGYIDMMLLHHPASNDVKAYTAIEEAIRDGKVRSAGISCYYIKETNRFLPQVTVKPALIQNEIHPYYQDSEVIRHIQNLDIAVQSWYPLGGRGYNHALLHDKVLQKIAETHGKTIPQVILRWDLQRGVVVIPGSGNPDHIRENISIFDFVLSQEEMETIASLERKEKHDWY